MPNTRKKVIQTVYKDDIDSDPDAEDPFSDSGSEAHISEAPTSDEEDYQGHSSSEEFNESKTISKPSARNKKKTFSKRFFSKISKPTPQDNIENANEPETPFSIKDLTDEDKLLPSVLNLSESDSSDEEYPNKAAAKPPLHKLDHEHQDPDSDDGESNEYKDVWSHNNDKSEEIARKTFLELEQHKTKFEETKAYVSNYTNKYNSESNVKDLLAAGEVVISVKPNTMKKKSKSLKKIKDDSDSEMEDWEEVKESRSIPQQGIQLVVDLPDSVCRKTKKIDVEMMMKRKMNRVKKEYQVYMHKVHVLCWLGHGNYVSRTLNNQELLAVSLSLVPSKECYPGERVDMKYIEQITTWYKDKLLLKQDKNENKYRPKAPPLKDLLISQIKSRVVTTKKYLVYIFVCILRALGLQCRVMFNFITLPIKPPSSELCSLSTKKDDKNVNNDKPSVSIKEMESKTSKKKNRPTKTQNKGNISQLDGTDDEIYDIFTNIVQLDGNNDNLTVETRSFRCRKQKSSNINQENVSPPKRAKKTPSPKTTKDKKSNQPNSKEFEENFTLKTDLTPKVSQKNNVKITKRNRSLSSDKSENGQQNPSPSKALRSKDTSKTKSIQANENTKTIQKTIKKVKKFQIPKIVVTKSQEDETSKYFSSDNITTTRRRSRTANTNTKIETEEQKSNKKRTKSAPGTSVQKSEYFSQNHDTTLKLTKKPKLSLTKIEKDIKLENQTRVSHRDLVKSRKIKSDKNDVTSDLVHLIKGRIKEAKQETRNKTVKGKFKEESDDNSDYLPEECPKALKNLDSDDDFKPKKTIAKPSCSKKIDRRVLSSDDDAPVNKIDVWCEVFIEELEQWVPIDVVKGKVHCAENIYTRATHPVCYIVGWDNNNYLKDLTRRYVPHWNTVTRKQRAEPAWWNTATQLWRGPNTARNKEEDEQLDRMQLEAPLPKSITEYKNHPLYALKRHLLKFEAIYPSDAAVLGFVRNEPVYARECVYICRSRDTWLKEAKVVRLGEQPYKVVKARPKWDKLSNKMITDKALEIFGPWQVQDYEPPVAAHGIVPRNAYGNVELFKACMLPKGTVHIKLPGLNKIAKKLNIDCAPAMTGFDFNGGWSHPVFDGFVVCKEFEEIIKEAWVNDQEDQERKEQEKNEARVYGNWRRLIKGLFIRERLRAKYGFEKPSTSTIKKSKGPRLVVKKV
ncbi:hypothetical protein ACJJTC_011750 [Scirpophaga incertulas]